MQPNLKETDDLVKCTEETLNGKLHFFKQCKNYVWCIFGNFRFQYFTTQQHFLLISSITSFDQEDIVG